MSLYTGLKRAAFGVPLSHRSRRPDPLRDPGGSRRASGSQDRGAGDALGQHKSTPQGRFPMFPVMRSAKADYFLARLLTMRWVWCGTIARSGAPAGLTPAFDAS